MSSLLGEDSVNNSPSPLSANTPLSGDSVASSFTQVLRGNYSPSPLSANTPLSGEVASSFTQVLGGNSSPLLASFPAVPQSFPAVPHVDGFSSGGSLSQLSDGLSSSSSSSHGRKKRGGRKKKRSRFNFLSTSSSSSSHGRKKKRSRPTHLGPKSMLSLESESEAFLRTPGSSVHANNDILVGFRDRRSSSDPKSSSLDYNINYMSQLLIRVIN